jgi:type I restriction enzyme, S subunit
LIAAEWIRTELPPSWRVARLRDHAAIVNGYPFDSGLFTADTGTPLVRIRDISSKETEVCYAGDAVPEAVLRGGEILIGMDGDFNVARWGGGEALLNQRVCSVVPAPTVDPQFLYYVLPAPLALINEFTYSTTVKHLSSFDILKIHFPLPPLAQQRAIADYLDRETARLDALVAAKERLFRLLVEKRRALITRAVTHGLSPAGPMRDSDVPWLWAIPAHWTTCHLRRALARMDYGISVPVEATGRIAVLRMGDIREGEIDYSAVGFVDEVDEALLLKPGDLVFNRTNSLDQIGKVALFRGKTEYPVSFASYLVRLRCRPGVLPDFLNWMLNSAFPQSWARAEALPAIGQANLNPNRYGYLPIALPPVVEQENIAGFLSGTIAQIDHVRAATEHTIDLLQARRSALIAAAVTGQLDVRNGP